MQIHGISPDAITSCGQIYLGDSEFGPQMESSPMDLGQLLGLSGTRLYAFCKLKGK